MDIDVLVAYIEAKGYAVDVCPGHIHINKGSCFLAWTISPVELRYAHDVVLFAAADTVMAKIDAAIAGTQEKNV